jgi:three-Cys-motif partner protein
MKTKWAGLTYVDLFAGPGVCVVRRTQEELDGSPLLALRTKTPFSTVVCIEEDLEARQALEERVRRRGQTAEILPGDCNAIIDNVIDKMPKRNLSLVFIDPEGVKDLDITTIKKLGKARKVDLIVLFAQNMAVNRNRWQWLTQTDTPLDKLLGGRWRTEKTPEVIQFMEALKTSGFTFVESARRAFRNQRGARLYYLVFASKSPVAAQFWRKISGDEHQMSLL